MIRNLYTVASGSWDNGLLYMLVYVAACFAIMSHRVCIVRPVNAYEFQSRTYGSDGCNCTHLHSSALKCYPDGCDICTNLHTLRRWHVVGSV